MIRFSDLVERYCWIRFLNGGQTGCRRRFDWRKKTPWMLQWYDDDCLIDWSWIVGFAHDIEAQPVKAWDDARLAEVTTESHKMFIAGLQASGLVILRRGKLEIIDLRFDFLLGDKLVRSYPELCVQSIPDALNFIVLRHHVLQDGVRLQVIAHAENLLHQSVIQMHFEPENGVVLVSASVNHHRDPSDPHPDLYVLVETVEGSPTRNGFDFVWLLESNFQWLGWRPIWVNVRALLSFAITLEVGVEAVNRLGGVDVWHEVEQHC